MAPATALAVADDAALDRVVSAFAGVIDAKSPYTHDHSRRVADYAVAAATTLGFSPRRLSRLKRTALLHDHVPVFREVTFDAACHHERLDGTGYHQGLAGAALSPSARVLAVADVTDALRSDRPYRAGLAVERVVGMLTADAASCKLCPQSVTAMADVLRA